MAITLEPDEQIKVERAKARMTEPTMYWSEAQGNMVEATEDFETYLILASASSKAEAVGWLRGATLPLGFDPIRAALMLDAYTRERLDLQAMRLQAAAILTPFYAFQNNFPGDGRFTSIPEVGMVRADSEVAVENIVNLERSWKYREACLEQVEAQYITLFPGLTDGRRKQVLSWINALSITTNV